MKLLKNLILVLVGVLMVSFINLCFAQDIAPIPGMDTALALLGPLLVSLAVKYPFVGVVIKVMIYCRLILKPVMSALITIAEQMPDNGFKKFMLKLAPSIWYKVFAYLLDWFCSVKLPKIEPKVA